MQGETINDRTRNNAYAELDALNRRVRKTSDGLAESVSRFEESKRAYDGTLKAIGSGIQSAIESIRNLARIDIREELKALIAAAKQPQPNIPTPEKPLEQQRSDFKLKNGM